MSENKVYYIIFHIEENGKIVDKMFSGKTYMVYGRDKDKKYAEFCENMVLPKFYKTERSAELAAMKLCNSCENVGDRYTITEADASVDKEKGQFVILFYYPDSPLMEAYDGSTYRYRGEKYANFATRGTDDAKIFQKRTAAIREAERLHRLCVNTGTMYYIKDLDTGRYIEDIRKVKVKSADVSDDVAPSKKTVERPESKKIAQCPYCGSSDGLYIERTVKTIFDYNGNRKEGKTDANPMKCVSCRKPIMALEEYELMYGVSVKTT